MPLIALPMLVWLWRSPQLTHEGTTPSDDINLALRRTADRLLRTAGDSTSRIPAIEQTDEHTWRILLDQSFNYDLLPTHLQASLDKYGVAMPYQVAIRRCIDAGIDLGYHQSDILNHEEAPCQGREMPEGCHYIEIVFESGGTSEAGWWHIPLLFLTGLGVMLLLFLNRKKPVTKGLPAHQPNLMLGNTSLDITSQVLLCAGQRQTLTFRETKLLRLFMAHPNRLLEREYILQQVWADEGVLVGRSLDVFVSRLRKKLTADPSLVIVAVHGVGYRLDAPA